MHDFLFALPENQAPRAYRIAGLAVALIVGACVALLAVTGASHQVEMPWDSTSLLDIAWRINSGELPHIDFPSHLGSLHPLLLAGMMKLAGPTADVLAYVPAVVAPFLAWAAWFIARRRLPAVPAAAFTLLVALLPMGTFWLSGGHHAQSYAMQYNREGWAIISIIALQHLLDPLSIAAGNKRSDLLDEMIGGGLLGLLVFHKINYLVVAGGIVAAGVFVRSQPFRRLPPLLGGMVLAMLPMLALLHFRLDLVLGDFAKLFSVERPQQRHVEALLGLLRMTIVEEVLLALLLVAAVLALRASATRRALLRVIVVSGLLYGGGLAVCRANLQFLDIPLFAVAGALVAELVRRNASRGYARAAAALALLLVVRYPIRDAESIAWSAAWKRSHAHDANVARIDSPRDASMPMLETTAGAHVDAATRILSRPPGEFLSPFEYAVWVNDGLALLRSQRATGPVFCVDIVNPFTYALGWRAPAGDAYWWNTGRSMDARHHPDVGRILASSRYAIVPRRAIGDPPSVQFVNELFMGRIERDFRLVAESRLWRLYARL